MGREAETQSHVEWDRPQAWQPSFIPPLVQSSRQPSPRKLLGET